MGLSDLPDTFTLGRSRNEHLADHQRLHRQHGGAVFSGDYASLQAALDDAQRKGRPLVIAPGVHVLTDTLTIVNATGLHVSGYGATLRWSADVETALDCNGVAYSSIEGLTLDTDGAAAQTMIALRWDGRVARSTTQNVFRDCAVRGRYVTGVAIGDGSFSVGGLHAQCDQTLFDTLAMRGQWIPGETVFWQRGIVCGDGLQGNNLLHRFHRLNCAYHRVHFELNHAAESSIGGASSFSVSECDLLVKTFGGFTVDGLRSEGAARLMVADSAPISSASTVTLRNVSFHPFDSVAYTLAEDRRWIDYALCGSLALDNVLYTYVEDGRAPILYARPPAELYLSIRGLAVGTPGRAPVAEAFDVANVVLRCEGYVETNARAPVTAVTPLVTIP